MTTTTYTLQDIRSYLIESAEEKNIKSPGMNFPNNNVYLYCLDTDTRVYITDLMIRKQNDWDYITVTGADGNSLSLWIDFDNEDEQGNKLTYQITIEHQEETDYNQETADDTADNQETADETIELSQIFNKVDRIVDQCQELSLDEILSVIGKLSGIANKKNKAENKPKKQKVEKPEKAEKAEKKSVRPFDPYWSILQDWKITQGSVENCVNTVNKKYNTNYSEATRNEDIKIINVLWGEDKSINISGDWSDYILECWENDPSVGTRLNVAFAKSIGRNACKKDLDSVLYYIIGQNHPTSGAIVTKKDIETIAAQN